ncbi:UDP-N-acetylmuramoyl-L-alanyl-D-glutamate--2,6-diaminopimelate ligase [Alphaproteobacteria bacterium]|nr:UDP-N-acetylmuramoyl-L-alanyl-D-glutamate--2,6-diaminopimelate ligase [Alphaproteobacteria bacterium]
MVLLRDLISKDKTLNNIFKDKKSLKMNYPIKGVSSNSKEIKKDYIFVALKGQKFDGSNFITEARKNGAVLILAENSHIEDVFSLQKGTARKVYSLFLSSFHEKQPKQIVGVTGTNGKTSVVEFCRQIWSQASWKAASIGTLGTKIDATSDKTSLLKSKHNLTTFEPSDLYEQLNYLASKEISHLAIEASSHGIDQCRLDGINFSGAVFTNLSHDHLDYHKSIENYYSSKKRLFTHLLNENSSIAINLDDNYGVKLYEELKKFNYMILTFGKKEAADIQIISITTNNKSIDLTLKFNNKIFQTTIGMIGQFQVYNIIASASICIALGMDSSFVFNSLSYLKPARGRMEIVSDNESKSLVIIDYAHTPEALYSVLSSLKHDAKGKIITLFGCGGNRDIEKRKLMGKVAHDNSELVIITDDNPREELPSKIRKEILQGCPDAIEIADRNSAIKFAVSKLRDNDLLLIAGKGHESTQTIGSESLPFDDYTVSKEAIKNIKKNGLIN